MSDHKSKLEIMREKLRAEHDKKNNLGNKPTSGDNAAFPFWNIPINSTATVRFLPDGNPDNEYFWLGREVIKLPFDGQIGGDYATDKPVTVTVPCMDMFTPGTCPIIAETKPWWKQGPDREALARLYYKKKSYLLQGFVVASDLKEETPPANPIRRFVVFPSIFKIIEKSIMDSEMENSPDDYVGGRDFKITRTKPGQWADYTTSSWSFRTRPLNEAETVAIQQHGLFNLSQFRGAEPDANGIAMIRQMFHESLDGKPFDFAAYGHLYRAYGNGQSTEDAAAAAIAATAAAPATPVAGTPAPRVVHAAEEPASVHEAASPAAATVAPDGGKPNVQDILDRVRRKTATA